MSRRAPAGAVLALALAIVSMAPAEAARTACVSARDEVALNARVLQTELMVAALACGEQRRYNAFVTAFRGAAGRSGWNRIRSKPLVS